MNSEKSINLFEIKKDGHLIIYRAIFFLQFVNNSSIIIIIMQNICIRVFHLYGNLPYTYPPSFSPFLRRPFLIPCHLLLPSLPLELPPMRM